MTIGVFSRGILHIPSLEAFLGAPVAAASFGRFRLPLDAVAGWGRRPTAARAIHYAQRHGLPYLALEDGFLRSVGLGRHDGPLSMAIDDVGVYYDAGQPSRLEKLISRTLSREEADRAQALIAAWRSGRVSKYNHLREYAGELPERYVLVADQTYGDAAIQFGLASPASFQRMLQAALAENPDCMVLLKIHPDVFGGKKRGYFDVDTVSRMPRVEVMREDAHPAGLIEQAEAVYAVTSQLGFEGLLWGKRVRTFGMPFYAGWGLTGDDLPAPERRRKMPLENLAHAALVEYAVYVHPETGRRCEAEQVIEWMALQRRMRERFPAVVHALGFPVNKRNAVRRFLQGSEVHFLSQAGQIPAGATLAVWGRPRAASGALLTEKWTSICLEDGFLRSVGLGADLVRPLSWAVDTRGIYYDATCPSDLEHLLQTTDFDEALLERARHLRASIVRHALTKYNVGLAGWRRPDGASRVVLVPGQVESDASLAYGAPEIRRNLDLLRQVRMACPAAHVVYKPHPDVVAGLRRQGRDEGDAIRWCDEVVTDVGMGDLLSQVDEVHTMTSLAGFEALLRGKQVTCYGQPFYSGWGLTADRIPLGRRSRQLTLDQLVAGVLIAYPTYVSRSTGRFTTPERALDELLAWRERTPPALPLWRRGLRWALGLRKP